ncbi:unnamed protein product [Nippostrongylus brasiliensis]|uniref:Transmembrane protein n=1 Tax=Nippostrongylus brasiliensis TaxID=27835 RepID=A0A0N4XUC2_NIPBR|nr:unnamed protein product [Nippostrongylus brasiliensis]
MKGEDALCPCQHEGKSSRYRDTWNILQSIKQSLLVDKTGVPMRYLNVVVFFVVYCTRLYTNSPRAMHTADQQTYDEMRDGGPTTPCKFNTV